MSDAPRTPEFPESPDHTPTDRIDPDATPATTPTPGTPAARRSRGRTALVVGGAVVAAAVLAGGGVALGAALADDEDDDRDYAAEAARDAGPADDRSDDRGTALPADLGAAGASELTDLVETAAAEAEGDAIAIDARRDGSWDVQFRTAAGAETEVRVAADGSTAVIETDTDADDVPAGALDTDTIAALVEAALAEADGRILDLEVDDDGSSPYDVTVLQSDGRTVSIDLDAQFAVVGTELDD